MDDDGDGGGDGGGGGGVGGGASNVYIWSVYCIIIMKKLMIGFISFLGPSLNRRTDKLISLLPAFRTIPFVERA